MQQTEKYQFNLIETSDAFSPAPLNENMEKVEAALGTKIGPDVTDALEQRVQVLELHKVAAGYYIGDGGKGDDGQVIELGFTPAIVITDLPNPRHTKRTLCVLGSPNASVEIVPGGFKVKACSIPTSSSSDINYSSLNDKDTKYRYLALC